MNGRLSVFRKYTGFKTFLTHDGLSKVFIRHGWNIEAILSNSRDEETNKSKHDVSLLRSMESKEHSHKTCITDVKDWRRSHWAAASRIQEDLSLNMCDYMCIHSADKHTTLVMMSSFQSIHGSSQMDNQMYVIITFLHFWQNSVFFNSFFSWQMIASISFNLFWHLRERNNGKHKF